jgi:hypothetical protein
MVLSPAYEVNRHVSTLPYVDIEQKSVLPKIHEVLRSSRVFGADRDYFRRCGEALRRGQPDQSCRPDRRTDGAYWVDQEGTGQLAGFSRSVPRRPRRRLSQLGGLDS